MSEAPKTTVAPGQIWRPTRGAARPKIISHISNNGLIYARQHPKVGNALPTCTTMPSMLWINLVAASSKGRRSRTSVTTDEMMRRRHVVGPVPCACLGVELYDAETSGTLIARWDALMLPGDSITLPPMSKWLEGAANV